jgi:hypothetical protein
MGHGSLDMLSRHIVKCAPPRMGFHWSWHGVGAVKQDAPPCGTALYLERNGVTCEADANYSADSRTGIVRAVPWRAGCVLGALKPWAGVVRASAIIGLQNTGTRYTRGVIGAEGHGDTRRVEWNREGWKASRTMSRILLFYSYYVLK